MIDLYSITPQAFEDLCCDYISNIYNKDKNYQVDHTRYSHDGGRDIEITFYDELHHFKIWAECKQHKRNIGLDDIGKNVVLIISKHIHKVIFFSVSEITESAQLEIIKIGDKLNFSVSFLCGDKLLLQLKTQPELLIKYFGNAALEELRRQHSRPIIEDRITINCSISEFNNDNLLPVKEQSPVYLRSGEMFNIYVHLRNETSAPFREITVEMFAAPNAIKMTNTKWSHDILASQEDIVACFEGEIISKQKSRIALPKVALRYHTRKAARNQIISLPELDISKCKIYPFIGKSVTEFMSNQIGQALEWSARSHAQIIDLRGVNGSGKTRLASEIQKRAACLGLHPIYLNCTDYIENDLIRKLLCELLHLPFYRGKINYSREDVEELIQIQGGSATFSNIMASFVCGGVWKKEFSHYLVESIAHFLQEPYREAGYHITIDNTQALHPELLKLLIRLSELLSKNPSPTIIIFISNTERRAASPKTFQTFLSYLDEKGRAHSPGFLSYTCSAFREEDATVLLMQLFGFKNPCDPLLRELLKHAGRLPFELTMAMEYLSDMNIIKWHNAKEWLIPDVEKFRAFLSNGFTEKCSILTSRANAWNQTHTVAQTSKFTDILSTVVTFGGILPYSYISDNRLDQNILDEMNQMLWLAPSHTQRGMTFFHDNIMDFCRSMPQYNNNAKVLRKIINWLTINQEIEIPHREKIQFFCYYNLGRVSDAFRFGQELLCKSNQLPYEDTLEISRTLYEDSLAKENPGTYLQIAEIYARAVASMDNKELGSTIYEEAIAYLKLHPSATDVTSSCRLLHQAINSQLQSAKYDNAIEWLGILEHLPELPLKYQFITENRYGVTFIALGQFEEAAERLQSALKIASNQLKDRFWTSTAHSDIALYYFYHWRAYGRETTKKHIICEFEAAISDYNICETHSISRDIEMSWHKAFVRILQAQYNSAIAFANECIQLSEEHSQSYGLSRGYNLLALSQLLNGDIEDAVATLEEGLHTCMLYAFPSGIFRMYNNLGVLHYHNSDCEKAGYYFKLAKSTLDGQIEFKQYPVLTNLMLVADRLKDTKLQREVEHYCNEVTSTELFEYCKDIINNRHDVLDAFSFWGFDGAGYIF